MLPIVLIELMTLSSETFGKVYGRATIPTVDLGRAFISVGLSTLIFTFVEKMLISSN